MLPNFEVHKMERGARTEEGIRFKRGTKGTNAKNGGLDEASYAGRIRLARETKTKTNILEGKVLGGKGF